MAGFLTLSSGQRVVLFKDDATAQAHLAQLDAANMRQELVQQDVGLLADKQAALVYELTSSNQSILSGAVLQSLRGQLFLVLPGVPYGLLPLGSDRGLTNYTTLNYS